MHSSRGFQRSHPPGDRKGNGGESASTTCSLTAAARKNPEADLSRRGMVRTERLELSHLAALEPKSSVSTNFTTSARPVQKRKRQARPGDSEYGVDDGNRTHDTRSHNPVLYQLSYAHHILLETKRLTGAPGRTRTCDHPLRRRMLYPAELRARLWLQPSSRITWQSFDCQQVGQPPNQPCSALAAWAVPVKRGTC